MVCNFSFGELKQEQERLLAEKRVVNGFEELIKSYGEDPV